MKNAANCDTLCELQDFVNHRNFERTLRSRAILGADLIEYLSKPLRTLLGFLVVFLLYLQKE